MSELLGQVSAHVWLACGYGVLLLLVAYAVDLAARALVSRNASLNGDVDHGGHAPHASEPWPASEAERFHRGIACAVVVVAIIWPLGILATGPDGAEVGLLVLTILVVGVASLPLWRHLRRTPAGFPESATTTEALAQDGALARDDLRTAQAVRPRARKDEAP